MVCFWIQICSRQCWWSAPNTSTPSYHPHMLVSWSWCAFANKSLHLLLFFIGLPSSYWRTLPKYDSWKCLGLSIPPTATLPPSLTNPPPLANGGQVQECGSSTLFPWVEMAPKDTLPSSTPHRIRQGLPSVGFASDPPHIDSSSLSTSSISILLLQGTFPENSTCT